MERKIGAQFDYDGVKLEVAEWEEDNGCEDCYLSDCTCCRFDEIIDITGYCSSSERDDKKEVIFKKVE